jgi:hypothetical protein
MTLDQAVQSISAKLADSAPATLDRIRSVIPLGVSQFCAEYEWEFLSKFTSSTAALDAITGFYKVTKPADFFKPIVLWTDMAPEVEYIDRYEFASRQMPSGAAISPRAYTVIGEEMYLDAASSGERIYFIYTKRANNVGFEDVPGQYHNAILLAVLTHLTPVVLRTANGDVANPAYNQSQELYELALQRALGLEAESKGRPRRWKPNSLMQLRGQYR